MFDERCCVLKVPLHVPSHQRDRLSRLAFSERVGMHNEVSSGHFNLCSYNLFCIIRSAVCLDVRLMIMCLATHSRRSYRTKIKLTSKPTFYNSS